MSLHSQEPKLLNSWNRFTSSQFSAPQTRPSSSAPPPKPSTQLLQSLACLWDILEKQCSQEICPVPWPPLFYKDDELLHAETFSRCTSTVFLVVSLEILAILGLLQTLWLLQTLLLTSCLLPFL